MGYTSWSIFARDGDIVHATPCESPNDLKRNKHWPPLRTPTTELYIARRPKRTRWVLPGGTGLSTLTRPVPCGLRFDNLRGQITREVIGETSGIPHHVNK